MKVQANEDFDKVLMSFSSEIQGIAQEARSLIYEILPEVVEVVWERQKTAGYGTGPKKMSEHFCWIAPYKKHVVLGFNYGSELPDPHHILEGTGKLFRHVKLSKIDDVRKSSIRNLIKAATTHRVPPPKEQ
jgi:hypothetical protein